MLRIMLFLYLMKTYHKYNNGTISGTKILLSYNSEMEISQCTGSELQINSKLQILISCTELARNHLFLSMEHGTNFENLKLCSMYTYTNRQCNLLKKILFQNSAVYMATFGNSSCQERTRAKPGREEFVQTTW